MNKIEIIFKTHNNKERIQILNKNEGLKIILNINKLDNYELIKLIYKIEKILSVFREIIKINIVFENDLNIKLILSKLNNILYKYYPITKKIKIDMHKSIDSRKKNYINFMNELFLYKDISMNPNKNPDLYLKYVISRIPKSHKYRLFNINKTNIFPLTKAVGLGSNYKSYFIHIYPKKINKNNKNIFCIGKAVTYDSGGMNLKSRGMEDMKIDMIGSAILISVLNLIYFDKEILSNIHLLIPIVENMIGPNATKPGSTVKSLNGKIVEIINTDAEGRLCIVDAINYCQQIDSLKYNNNNNLILDIATLTGNTEYITGSISSICTSNENGYNYALKLIDIGKNNSEYVDYLKIRKEYLEFLESEVGDIKNVNKNEKFGCMLGAIFINYFVNEKIPWIHLDIASCVFKNNKVLSYGINLLYEFIQKL
jgi:leucyl aminopeptidase